MDETTDRVGRATSGWAGGSTAPPNVLIVDDVDSNILAMRSVLEPLPIAIHEATSGQQALRQLREHRMSLVLLDIQMPVMDGFAVAETMTQDPTTKDVPIIFVTAHESTSGAIERGYRLGAIDYIVKPFDPMAVRLKVQSMLRLRGFADDQVRQYSERYLRLLDAMPQLVWTSDPDGRLMRANQRWFEFTGTQVERATIEDLDHAVHPSDLERVRTSRILARTTGQTQSAEARLKSLDGDFRWHIVRLQPAQDHDERLAGWIGTAIDIHESKVGAGHRLLSSVGAILDGGMEYRQMLPSIAPLAVPVLGDWVAVGALDGTNLTWPSVASSTDAGGGAGLEDRFEAWFVEHPTQFMDLGEVLASGRSHFLPIVDPTVRARWASDDAGAKLIEDMDFTSSLVVPIRGTDDIVGVLVVARRGAAPRLELEDLHLAESLAARLGHTIHRGQELEALTAGANASLVLRFVGDGVLLLDADDVVRVWNPAAARITGLPADSVLGRDVRDAVPGWEQIAERIPVARTELDDLPTASTLPIELGDRELWISISGVAFGSGTAFAFRDTTETHRIEQMQSEFVATVSHELRTPLAAVSGACDTMLRSDIALSDDTRASLMEMVSEQSNRLASIVDDVLLASRLKSGQMTVNAQACDARQIAERVLTAARVHAPANVELILEAPDAMPSVLADGELLYTVLSNLVDNAIKYSPSGGSVRVVFQPRDRQMRISVVDEGIGISRLDAEHVFQKFYRSDPGMLRGIRGTGLGLYICKELVEQMGGRLWLEPPLAPGSIFTAELPTTPMGHDDGGGGETSTIAHTTRSSDGT